MSMIVNHHATLPEPDLDPQELLTAVKQVFDERFRKSHSPKTIDIARLEKGDDLYNFVSPYNVYRAVFLLIMQTENPWGHDDVAQKLGGNPKTIKEMIERAQRAIENRTKADSKDYVRTYYDTYQILGKEPVFKTCLANVNDEKFFPKSEKAATQLVRPFSQPKSHITAPVAAPKPPAPHEHDSAPDPIPVVPPTPENNKIALLMETPAGRVTVQMICDKLADIFNKSTQTNKTVDPKELLNSINDRDKIRNNLNNIAMHITWTLAQEKNPSIEPRDLGRHFERCNPRIVKLGLQSVAKQLDQKSVDTKFFIEKLATGLGCSDQQTNNLLHPARVI